MKNTKGFTLLELGVVLLIIFLLLSFLPSIVKTSDTYKLTMSAQNIASELQTARLFAVARGEQINIDFVNQDGNSIDPNAIPSPGPSRYVFIQTNVRGIRVSDSQSNPLRSSVGPGNIFQIPKDVTITDIPAQPVRFASRGGSSNGDGTISLSNATGSIDIRISSGGRVLIIDNRSGS